MDDPELWPPEEEDEEEVNAATSNKEHDTTEDTEGKKVVDVVTEEPKEDENGEEIGVMKEVGAERELVEDDDDGEDTQGNNRINTEKEKGVEVDESSDDVVEKVVRRKRKRRQSNSRAEENDFKKYKVKDIYKINLAHEFDESLLRKKLFKIKCPLVRKKKDGSYTRPKTFHKKILINCNHWISWTCHMGTSEMPYNYHTMHPSELHVGTFLMNLRKKYRDGNLLNRYKRFVEEQMRYKLKVYKNN